MRYPKAIAALTAASIVSASFLWLAVHAHRASLPGASQAVTGELVGYEELSRRLILRTNAGDRYFIVHAGTPVHEGAQTLTLASLPAANGCRAKVWCSDDAGRCTVSEIRISCGSVATGSAPARP